MAASLTDQLIKWSCAIGNEVDWWSLWMRTKGMEWPKDFEDRLVPDSQWDVNNAPVPEANWKILNVGSGPITRLGKMVGDSKLDITAVDPLAPYYNKALIAHGVTPPISTIQAFGEDLSAFFEENTFDLVNCQNALDHSMNPVRAIEEMLLVTKIGGKVVLTHALNEAERAEYDGFHQWNFDMQDGRFRISNKYGAYIAEDIYGEYAHVETFMHTIWIRTILTKLKNPPFDMAKRQRDRIKEFVPASLDALFQLQTKIDPASATPFTKQDVKPKRSPWWKRP